ncbi:MAG TPA: DUF1894 domain-containing protein [Methanolinea sp.]|nr:DUF1894 domain-containing protein [Methanolinea sp.]HQK55238.1 DUF1894 domain-containing protein [Methanolinea sp.]
MGCIESLKYEIVLQGASFAECRSYVMAHCREQVTVDPGFKIFEKPIIGIPPILIGLDGDLITFPYTKPCYGTFLLQTENPPEAARIRSLGKK